MSSDTILDSVLDDFQDILVKENETESQYIWRMGQKKDRGEDVNWEDVAEEICNNFHGGLNGRKGTTYQKIYGAVRNFYLDGVFHNDLNVPGTGTDIDFEAKKAELIAEKQSIRDERYALNRFYRENSRLITLTDKIKDILSDFECKSYPYSPNTTTIYGDSDLIIHLTDVHCGVEINSPLNKFDNDVLSYRLETYLDNIYTVKNRHKAENAYVIIGGDLINGLIHTNSRIEAKDDIVTQIKNVSNHISHFVYTLSGWFNEVKVYTVAGNHSRSHADKDKAVRKENFDLLIPFICGKELAAVKNVEFIDNTIDVDIANFSVREWSIWATHGDKDTVENVTNHFTHFARQLGVAAPDVIYMGHRHSNGYSTINGIKVVESGCIDGLDSYAIGKRFTGKPEQTITVVTDDKPTYAIYDVTLD